MRPSIYLVSAAIFAAAAVTVGIVFAIKGSPGYGLGSMCLVVALVGLLAYKSPARLTKESIEFYERHQRDFEESKEASGRPNSPSDWERDGKP